MPHIKVNCCQAFLLYINKRSGTSCLTLFPKLPKKPACRRPPSVITIRKGCCPTSNGKTASVCLKTWTCGRLMGLLTCLKNTGMPIKRIRDYVELTSKGDDTLQERYEIIKAQRQFVLDQIEQLQYYLEELDFKDWYYNKALAAGSESAINLDDYEKETGKKAPDDPNRQD